jgi:hypothetical protein
MRRTSLLAAFLAALLPAFSEAGIHVESKGGRVSIHATGASIPDILEKLREETGMRVIYDGAPPDDQVELAVVDLTPVGAVVSLLEHRAIKYAMVLDASGAQVEVLLISTAPPPPRPAEGPLDGIGGGMMADVEGDPGLSPGEDMVPPPPLPPPMPASAASGAAMQPWVMATPPPPPASPFTPQGPGPIILPLPGAPTSAPAAPAPQAGPTAMPDSIQGPSTAEMPPWERGY